MRTVFSIAFQSLGSLPKDLESVSNMTYLDERLGREGCSLEVDAFGFDEVCSSASDLG